MKIRKDNKGRRLKTGESQRTNGTYMYRYTDILTGNRNTIYASDLSELRQAEQKILHDMDCNLITDNSSKKIKVQDLFERYISTKDLSNSTKQNYISLWNHLVRDSIGNISVTQLKPSHIKVLFAGLNDQNYSRSTIKILYAILYPCLDLALDDGIIQRNPLQSVSSNYGRQAKTREALSLQQQNKLFEFVANHQIYNRYLFMLQIMLGTGCRCGELIGLTWNDVDMENKEISINHQLIYKNYGDGYRFHATSPKSESGNRIIPMSNMVYEAFKKQKKLNLLLRFPLDIEVCGYSQFIFIGKNGNPLMPNAVNNVLYNIVDAYNKKEHKKAIYENRKEELFPKISSHILRHTSCTRMAENGLDMKVVQYIMGHSKIDMTLNVYTHIADRKRINKEVAKMNQPKNMISKHNSYYILDDIKEE